MHHHLRSLQLRDIEVKAVDAGFWRACANLERLELHFVTIVSEAVPSDLVLDRMRILTVEQGMRSPDQVDQLNLMLRCPRHRGRCRRSC